MKTTDEVRSSSLGSVGIWGPFAILVLASYLFSGHFQYSYDLKEGASSTDLLIMALAPAFVSALLVERAVEIVVAKSRGAEQRQREEDIAALAQTDTADRSAIQSRLDYQRGTARLALSASLGFSFLLALAGVRILSQLFEIPLLECVHDPILIDPEECPNELEDVRDHYQFFLGVDLLITTLVIAGGSDGLHAIVNAITQFAKRA